jgi:hypothetical protein
MTAKLLQTFPVSAGLLDPQHVQAIGGALWVYLWFLNRVTRDEQRVGGEFIGIVRNGRPVSIDEIAGELGIDYRTCRRHLARLVDAEYVLQKRTGAGTCTYAVTKSKRWAWKRRGSTGAKVASGSPDPQAQFWPVGPEPQTTSDLSTGQKWPQHKDGSRARSQESQESHKERGRSRSTLSELPTDFAPKDSHRHLARELNLNLEMVSIKFCDHHASKGTKFKDWDRALNTWMRREHEFARSGGPTCIAAFRPTPAPPAWSEEVKREMELRRAERVVQ